MDITPPTWLVRALVDGEIPAGDGAVSLVFERPMPGWAWLLVAVAALATAWWSYRRLAGATRGSTRVVRGALLALRTATLVVVALLIAGPSLRFARESVERDRLLVLVDRSRSLAIADAPGGISRDAQAAELLRGAEPALREIAQGKEIDFVGFAEGAFALGAAAVPAPAAESTETIEQMLQSALRTMSVRDAAEAVAAASGRPKREVYAQALTLSGRKNETAG